MTAVSEETADRLLRFVTTEVSVVPDPIEVETDLLLTGAVDSLGVMRITQWMEDELGVEVDPVDVTLENFQTIGRMLAYLGSRTGS